MKKSIRTYRFAYWGILSLVIIHFAYYLFLYFRYYANAGEFVYTTSIASLLVTRFLIFSIIMGIEILVYWYIRHRLYRKVWVRMHVILLWTAVIFVRFIFGFVFFFASDSIVSGADSDRNVYDILVGLHRILYWGSLIVGHLFFIATIVKSFSKKELPQPDDDDANSPHILDEFDQQSPGL